MDFDTAFELTADFAKKALADNPEGFEPCIFTFRGANLKKTEMVGIPWPVTDEALRLLSHQFAATRVTLYIVLVCERLRIGDVEGDYVLHWGCTAGVLQGRAYEFADGQVGEGFRELAAQPKARLFRLLSDGPVLTERQALRVRRHLKRLAAPPVAN